MSEEVVLRGAPPPPGRRRRPPSYYRPTAAADRGHTQAVAADRGHTQGRAAVHVVAVRREGCSSKTSTSKPSCVCCPSARWSAARLTRAVGGRPLWRSSPAAKAPWHVQWGGGHLAPRPHAAVLLTGVRAQLAAPAARPPKQWQRGPMGGEGRGRPAEKTDAAPSAPAPAVAVKAEAAAGTSTISSSSSSSRRDSAHPQQPLGHWP